MSDIEFVGQMNPQPFISLRKEEEMRIQEIKNRISNKKLNSLFINEQKSELTYERDVQENY